MSPTTHSPPFAALRQVAVSSQRRRRVPIGPAMEAAVGLTQGPSRPQWPPDARSGGRRGPRCFWQHGPRASGARGAFDGQWCRRQAASRAPLVLLWPLAISLVRDSRRWSRGMALKRLRAGWGWAGGGSRSHRGRAERRGHILRAVVAAYLREYGISTYFEIVRDRMYSSDHKLWFQCFVCSFYMLSMMCDAKNPVCGDFSCPP